MLTVGSLFSGIGGMDLGLERAGMKVIWQSEIDTYASKVLKKHWPQVKNLGDITKIDWNCIETPDVIAGGFPCQDISYAGKGVGIHGDRSGLFFELMRCVRMVRPKIIILENVAALLTRGLGVVLRELAAVGYDAEWHCIPAGYFGTHFRRDRIFIVAYRPKSCCLRWERQWANTRGTWSQQQFEGLVQRELQLCVPAGKMQRVSDGISNRVDRLKGLGNAVVPQVSEYIGKRLVEAFDVNT